MLPLPFYPPPSSLPQSFPLFLRAGAAGGMGSVTYDLQWKESMVELLDQLEVLDPTTGEELQKQVDALDKDEKFQHYATLYIRYLQIFRKVEESYDMIVHPQKRMDIRKALEAVMGRVLEVKCLLIEQNKGVSFVNLDDILVDLKLAPDVLEVPVPKYFIEDQARALEEREKLLDVLQLQAGIDPKKGKTQARDDSMTLESALRVVQLNERGRQGRQRAKFMKEIRAQEDRERKVMQRGGEEKEPEAAAVMLQQYWRGYSSRKTTSIMRPPRVAREPGLAAPRGPPSLPEPPGTPDCRAATGRSHARHAPTPPRGAMRTQRIARLGASWKALWAAGRTYVPTHPLASLQAPRGARLHRDDAPAA